MVREQIAGARAEEHSRARGHAQGAATRIHARKPAPSPMTIGRCQSAWAKPSASPYIVALMTELAPWTRQPRAEIGTGRATRPQCSPSLAQMSTRIEILAPLRERAGEILARLGYAQVKTRVGDGYLAARGRAFDAIIVTAAPPACRSHSCSSSRSAVDWSCPVGRYDQELE